MSEIKVGDIVVCTCDSSCRFYSDDLADECALAPRVFRVLHIDLEAVTPSPGDVVNWGPGQIEFCPRGQLRLQQTARIVGNELVLEEA